MRVPVGVGQEAVKQQSLQRILPESAVLQVDGTKIAADGASDSKAVRQCGMDGGVLQMGAPERREVDKVFCRPRHKPAQRRLAPRSGQVHGLRRRNVAFGQVCQFRAAIQEQKLQPLQRRQLLREGPAFLHVQPLQLVQPSDARVQRPRWGGAGAGAAGRGCGVVAQPQVGDPPSPAPPPPKATTTVITAVSACTAFGSDVDKVVDRRRRLVTEARVGPRQEVGRNKGVRSVDAGGRRHGRRGQQEPSLSYIPR